MCKLVENLLDKIVMKSNLNKNSQEFSVKRSRDYGIEFLNRIGFRNDNENK